MISLFLLILHVDTVFSICWVKHDILLNLISFLFLLWSDYSHAQAVPVAL